MILRTTGLPSWLPPVWRTCIALALARSSSTGVKRVRVALPVSPVRHRSAGGDGYHRPHGKVARRHEERVASPPRHQEEDDYSPSDDGTNSASESERWSPGLSPACLVLFPLGGLLLLGVRALGAWVLGPQADSLSAGLVLILDSFQVLTISDATTSARRVFDGQRAPS
jgi:hypothetical protein